MKKRFQFAVFLMFCALVAGFVYKPPCTSGDVAAWVQAVGSIAAIVAAVLIASDQHRRSERRAAADAQADVRNFLAGVREELKASTTAYMEEAGNELEQTTVGQPVEFWWPAPPEPFKVYNATVSLIGRVSDDVLRGHIIKTYVVMGGLLLTWQTHNRLLDEAEKAAADLSFAGLGELETRKEQALEKAATLRDYSQQLRTHHATAIGLATETIALIDHDLANAVQTSS